MRYQFFFCEYSMKYLDEHLRYISDESGRLSYAKPN